MNTQQIAIGTKVNWRGAWGTQPAKEVTIFSITLCKKERMKWGKPVDCVDIKQKDKCVFMFEENGHWAYGYQIDLLN